MQITSFKDEYKWLSNFYPCIVMFEGLQYPTVEHAYVAAKTTNQDIRKHIQSISTAGKAKIFGRSLEYRPNWDDMKVKVMSFLLEQKFKQEPFKTWLDETGDAKLIEGNNHGDVFFGCVYDFENQVYIGKNVLGELLMSIRLKNRLQL